jgi:hypothetical protein
MRRIILMAVAVAVTASDYALAQTDRLQPDFTFRRVAVPTPGTTRRITVQIDPDAPSAIRAPDGPRAADSPASGGTGPGSGPVAAAMPRPSGYEWFWTSVSARIADSGPGRLEPALRHLANAPAGQQVAAPRLQSMQEIARVHGQDILRATVGTRVSPALVLAVISIESAGRSDAVSSAGAAGLMQLMPATAARFGVTDRLITAENIRGGVAYLDWLMGHFNNDPILVLAGYNAGEGSVRDHAGVPPYAETRGYVPKVLAAWTVARGLCQTPPVLMSDGCVFAVNNL